MRIAPAVVQHAELALREVLNFSSPADGALSRYFREHPKLGSRERGVMAEAIYTVLRYRSFFTDFAEAGSGATIRRLVLLGLADTVGVEAIPGLSEIEVAWLERMVQIDRSLLSINLRANLPAWLLELWIAQYGQEQMLALSDALNQPAPLDLRVNTIKSNREQVAEELAKAPILCTPTPFSPLGLRILKKPALQNLPLFKDGAIEVQDEGSQLLALIVGAKRSEMVVDFCAGAGGKTLALGALMRNTGRLYAFDISEKRLAKLKPRLAKSGLSNVHPVLIAHENDTKVKRLAGKADRVLVDAPCSGLGTLRRNPDVKWRQQPRDIAELNVKQASILAGAARMVKVGGRIVYATCSLIDAENEGIVSQFLLSHPGFQLVPMKQVLAEQKIELAMDDYLKLMPHLHQTDGFFAAVLERVALSTSSTQPDGSA